MWVIPNRVLYDTEHSNIFRRQDDLRIFFMKDGAVENIDPMRADVKIVIDFYPVSAVNPDDPENPASSFPVEKSWHQFDTTGRYVVHVEYQDKTDLYSVEVRGYGTGTDPADDAFGTYIKWW
jgi:hypothetical protein